MPALRSPINAMNSPTPAATAPDSRTEPEMRWVMDFIEGVRQIRSGMDIAPSRKLDVLLQNASPTDTGYLERHGAYLMRLAGVTPPQVLVPGDAAPISAVALLVVLFFPGGFLGAALSREARS